MERPKAMSHAADRQAGTRTHRYYERRGAVHDLPVESFETLDGQLDDRFPSRRAVVGAKPAGRLGLAARRHAFASVAEMVSQAATLPRDTERFVIRFGWISTTSPV
jgi:hypothetical protein